MDDPLRDVRRELLLKRDGVDTSIVHLLPANEEAARIFHLVRGQVVTRSIGDGKVSVELNHLAVWAAIDAYGVTDRTAVFERVLRLFGEAGPDNGATDQLER